MTPKHRECCFLFWLKSCTSALTEPWGSVGAQGDKFLKYRVSLQCVGVCLADMQRHGPLPDGILAFRCDGICSVEPPSAPHSPQQELWVLTAPGHIAWRILKGQMTQTNNGLGEALRSLAGTVLVKGRISAGAPHGIRPPRSILCMHICLATVMLYLCGYICVPRQVFSELFCNKDRE